MPVNVAPNQYKCGTGCIYDTAKNLNYSLTDQTGMYNEAVADGSTAYDLTKSGYTLFNAAQRTSPADKAINCWTDAPSKPDVSDWDYNDAATMWTVKAAVVAQPPTVTTTSPVTAITATTATAAGNVTSDGGSPITERGIVYSDTATTPTTANNKVAVTGTTGEMSTNLTDLTPHKKYYVRAYATNAIGTAYGAVVEFTTTAQTTGLPVVVTSAVTAITQTTATAGGNVTSDGGHEITERGVVYSSTKTVPNIDDSTDVTATGTTGVFTTPLSGLTSRTKYYVRAYAINSVGIAYGAVVEFTTGTFIPTHTPTETGFVDDFLVYVGGFLYVIGIVTFVSAKALTRKEQHINPQK
jgi:hypothetical protein